MGDLPLRTPKHRRFGRPLPYQLANVTRANPSPSCEFLVLDDAVHTIYAVLDHVSMDYPPVTGMLLTRYAPLRRSPAKYCYLPLPLDLHVLSLPLAFILSQDQTLHCIMLYISKSVPLDSQKNLTLFL